MGEKAKSGLVTVVCGFVGCGKTQPVRQSGMTECDGYACSTTHLPRDGCAPGLVREEVMHAAGGFWGWRDTTAVTDRGPGSAPRGSEAREPEPREPESQGPEPRKSESQGPEARVWGEEARRPALLALAQAVPAGRIQEVVRALVDPVAPVGRHHILYVDELSTAVALDVDDGVLEIELPHVGAVLCALLASDRRAGLILRTFTDRTVRLPGRAHPVPVKEVRGWLVAHGRLRPLSGVEVADAYRTDPATRAPLPPLGRDVVFRDGWEVSLPG